MAHGRNKTILAPFFHLSQRCKENIQTLLSFYVGNNIFCVRVQPRNIWEVGERVCFDFIFYYSIRIMMRTVVWITFFQCRIIFSFQFIFCVSGCFLGCKKHHYYWIGSWPISTDQTRGYKTIALFFFFL